MSQVEKKEIDKELLEAATKLFDDETKAINWLNQPAIALGGIKPMEAQKEEVLRLIGRLEYGVYT